MGALQPKKKSFGHYVLLGYCYSGRKPSRKILKLMRWLSIIDDSVLIIDDILDKSQLRNGKPCLYIKEDVGSALIKAKSLERKFFSKLFLLSELCSTLPEFKIKLFEKANNFLNQINEGERINLINESKTKYSKKLEETYFEMIRLFTGGHIRFGFEIGQILANKNPNKHSSKVCEKIGMIRQIVDDYEDYYEKHHEPFGDFKNNSNRLPEIIFMKRKGDKKKIQRLLNKGKFEEARKLILSGIIREDLFDYCNDLFSSVDKNILRKSKISVPDFEQILKP